MWGNPAFEFCVGHCTNIDWRNTLVVLVVVLVHVARLGRRSDMYPYSEYCHRPKSTPVLLRGGACDGSLATGRVRSRHCVRDSHIGRPHRTRRFP